VGLPCSSRAHVATVNHRHQLTSCPLLLPPSAPRARAEEFEGEARELLQAQKPAATRPAAAAPKRTTAAAKPQAAAPKHALLQAQNRPTARKPAANQQRKQTAQKQAATKRP
jgi:hypothetical protein